MSVQEISKYVNPLLRNELYVYISDKSTGKEYFFKSRMYGNCCNEVCEHAAAHTIF